MNLETLSEFGSSSGQGEELMQELYDIEMVLDK